MRALGVAFGSLLGLAAIAGGQPSSIRHSTFEDFAAGSFPHGSSNLFISRAGELQMIHRWDLNNDGYLDLLVGQDHDLVENEDVLVYWGRRGGPRSLTPPLMDRQPLGRLLREVDEREHGVTRLPSDGGGRSLLVDLNHDGYDELVFCNFIHNYSVHMNALIYWGSAEGYRADRRTELPTLLADGVAAGDFDRDGDVDLAFANRGIEGGERFGFDAHLESYVYWNGPAGFSTDRRSSLPTVSAIDVDSGDVNGDGFPDLLFANNNSEETSYFLYWGSSDGFDESKRVEWSGGDPTSTTLADIDGDGELDFLVTHRDNRAEVYRGTAHGFAEEPWVSLPIAGAHESRYADLDDDGHLDLVFANPDGPTSYIYWGGATGFAVARRSELPTMHASDAAIGDFDGDGRVDVAFANERDSTTYDVRSYVYLNAADGFSRENRHELQGFGPVNAQAGDLNRDGQTDLVLVSRNSGSASAIPSVIYWGNAAHRYSPASMTTLPGVSESVPSVADLDQNGFVDIVLPNGWIYWGGVSGFSESRRSHLDVVAGHGTAIADLDQNGHLDVVVTAGTVGGGATPSTAHVFWGETSGFDRERRTDLELDTRISLSASVADLDQDGFLDLVVSDVDTENLNICYGSKAGIDAKPCALLRVQSSATVEVADLNADGWLDLILGGGWDRETFGRPTRRATLLWGSEEGFDPNRSQTLEAYNSLEQAVGDFDGNGYLDIVMTNYHAYLTRTLPVFIYWGSADGFSERRRANLPAESSGALTAADLDDNGYPDLVVFNHVELGDHGVGADIFWGSDEGYSAARRETIPTFGPHFGVRRDIGNLYSRELREVYVSAPLRYPGGRAPTKLTWVARTPHKTAVTFQLRSAASAAELASAAWEGPNGAASSYEKPDAPLNLPAAHGFVQYKVVLTTPNGGSTPVLEAVTLTAE